MHRYMIKYETPNGLKLMVFEGSDPGHAMEKAIKAGIRPISAIREGKYGDGYGYTEWNCPSRARVSATAEEKTEQLVMEL